MLALRVGGCGVDQVANQCLLHGLQRIVEDVLWNRLGVRGLHTGITSAQNANVFAHMPYVQQAGFEAVVEVRGKVSDLIRKVDDLGFEWWLLIEQVSGQFGVILGGVVAGVLDDALADGEREIQAPVAGVALLKSLDDAEGMQVVVEAEAVALQALVESALAGVTERRMADVMHQREGFGEVDVQAERAGDLAADLRNLNGVSETTAEVVGGAAGEDLRFAGEAAKGTRLDDPVTVAFEGRAVFALRRREGAEG